MREFIVLPVMGEEPVPFRLKGRVLYWGFLSADSHWFCFWRWLHVWGDWNGCRHSGGCCHQGAWWLKFRFRDSLRRWLYDEKRTQCWRPSEGVSHLRAVVSFPCLFQCLEVIACLRQLVGWLTLSSLFLMTEISFLRFFEEVIVWWEENPMLKTFWRWFSPLCSGELPPAYFNVWRWLHVWDNWSSGWHSHCALSLSASRINLVTGYSEQEYAVTGLQQTERKKPVFSRFGAQAFSLFRFIDYFTITILSFEL